MKNILSYRIYNYSLMAMLFCLPLFEAPKQIFLVLFLLSGFYIMYKNKISIKFDIINLSFIAFVVFSFISVILNDAPIKRVMDPFRCLLFFIVLRSVGVEKNNIKCIIYALFLGFLISFIIAVYQKFTGINPHGFIELKSIGHVNHSSIFMFLVFCIAMPFILNKDNIFKCICIFFAIVSFIGVIMTGSRATMYLLPIAIFFIILYFGTQISFKKSIFILITFTIISLIAIYYIPDDRILQKITKGISSSETRIPIFYSAFYTWQENPFFGIGSGNFESIDITKYFPGNFEVTRSHAHNTFLTFLTEKGIFALIGYLIFQIALFVNFILYFRKNMIIFSALSILFFNNIISLANTTFHHENALLMLCIWAIAMWCIKDEKNSIFKN